MLPDIGITHRCFLWNYTNLFKHHTHLPDTRTGKHAVNLTKPPKPEGFTASERPGMGQNAQISGLQCLQSLYAQALQLMCSIPQYDSIFKNFFFKKSWEMKKVWKINTSETCGTANKKGNVPKNIAFVAPLAWLEQATPWLTVRCSNRLS